MTTTHNEKIIATLALEGIAIDSPTAAKLVEKIGLHAVHDAPEGLLVFLGKEAMRAIAVDIVNQPKAQTSQQRAIEYLEARNFKLADLRAADRLRLIDHAMGEIAKADTAANSWHEERVLAGVLAKNPNRVDASDLLNVGHARDLDSATKPATKAPQVPASALPAIDPTAPRNPMARLRSVNKLSGPALSTWREWSTTTARIGTMPAGVDRMRLESHAANLSRALAVHGVVV